MLRTRVLTAAILAPLIVVVAWLGEPWLSLLVGLVVFLALAELIGLLDAAGFEPPQVVLMAVGLVVAGATLVAANQDSVGELLSNLLSATVIPGLPVMAFVAAVLVLAVAAFTRPDPRAGFLTWATSSFGVAYISLLLPFVALVGHLGPADGSAATEVGGLALKAGTAWLITLLLLVWGYDTGAYLTGRWIGRRRLIDHVSPSKTIEGLAGGLVAATIAAGIGTWLVGHGAVARLGHRPADRHSWRRRGTWPSRCSSAPPTGRTPASCSPGTAACSIASTRSCSPLPCWPATRCWSWAPARDRGRCPRQHRVDRTPGVGSHPGRTSTDSG